jgi:HlyD family secretion protein
MLTSKILWNSVFIVLGVALGLFINKIWEPQERLPSDSPPTQDGIETVLCEGRLMPLGGIRKVATIPGRRISVLNVAVGSVVEAGQTKLCVMEDEQTLLLQWQLAESRRDDAPLGIQQRKLAAQLNRAEASAALALARFNQEKYADDSPEVSNADQQIEASQKKLERLKSLAKAPSTSGFISVQDVIDQELQLQQAKNEKRGMQEATNLAVESAQETFQLTKELVELAENTSRNGKTLDLVAAAAKAQYENSILLAPVNGEVIRVHLKNGDLVSNVPLLEIANVETMTVQAEVFNASLGLIRVDQAVKITSPAFPEVMTGKVTAKSNYIGGASLQNPNPFAMVDQETAIVTIEIDPDFSETARKYINLQVSVEFEVR